MIAYGGSGKYQFSMFLPSSSFPCYFCKKNYHFPLIQDISALAKTNQKNIWNRTRIFLVHRSDDEMHSLLTTNNIWGLSGSFLFLSPGLDQPSSREI